MTATAVLREVAAIIEAFDAEVADELAQERERADLWTEVDVPVDLLRRISAALAEPAIEEGWQPIETAPKDTECFFWLDWADDCVALNPPIDTMAQLFRGKQRQWASVYKATHWRPLFSPPDEHTASLSREVVGVESKKDQFRRWR